ncbi:hypothetical protein AWB76_07855 [Caballeronia temeraria]|uniref:Uncharacterized protein n=1 Tax=Caballeronia temeraria TaxID=1777137 RepID=A0A158E3E4_9BURK|nr:hypothetical protein AWB76_07855 [Caballeronia temeraria]
MPTEGKEVIEHTHACEPEHIGEALRKRRFERCTRPDISRKILPLRIGQCAPIELAVGRKRQRIEHDERRWHHIVRQTFAQLLAQDAAIDIARSSDVSDELLILRFLMPRPRDDHGFTHSRMTGDLRLDLAELDTKAANLDLMIVAAEELDIAIGAITREVSRSIHATTRSERIVEKAFGGEFGPIQIAPRHTRTTDI